MDDNVMSGQKTSGNQPMSRLAGVSAGVIARRRHTQN